jgi:hypothetical protein
VSKNNRHNARALALALALCLPAAGALARQAPMVEPGRELLVSASAPASAPQTGENVRRAVVQGASRHDWHVKEDTPGRLTLEYVKGSHQVVVDVDYDAQGYQIKYRESSDMNYELEDGRRYIHPNYNKWIANLGAAIRQANAR